MEHISIGLLICALEAVKRCEDKFWVDPIFRAQLYYNISEMRNSSKKLPLITEGTTQHVSG